MMVYAFATVVLAHFAGIGFGGVLVLGAFFGFVLCFFLRRASFIRHFLILIGFIALITFLKIQLRI